MSKGTINKVMLIGRLGQDPDVRYSANGVAIAKFSLATNDYAGGENREERTEWHRIVTFGKTADFCGNYLSKGRLVYVVGSIRSNQWEDAQGQKRYSTEIIAREIQPLEKAPTGAADQQAATQSGASSQGALDDDIPF